MADFSDILFSPSQSDYIARLNLLRTRTEAAVSEIEAGREGMPSLLANNLRYIKAAAGLSQALPTNGYRITGLPSPVANDEPATKGYADGLSFSSALPAQAAGAGLEITTNGVTASWGLTVPGSIALLTSLGFFG